MPYIANMNTANDLVTAKKLVGNGQCVTFVHAVVAIPPASLWRRGNLVKDARHISSGTVIATFDDNGRYGNHTNGTSHAAVYLYQNSVGIIVLDQWKGRDAVHDHPPQQRTIFFNRSANKKVNQGEKYYVVQ